MSCEGIDLLSNAPS